MTTPAAKPRMLEGKVAVVTGAGGGIGREIATAMAEAGASVLINDIGASLSGKGEQSATPAQQTKQIIEQRGGKAAINTNSVSSWDSAQAIVADAIKAFGRIDIVVNNAGILRDVIFHKMTPEDWSSVIDVHLNGSFFVSRAAADHFRKQESGAYVHMTSTSGLVGNFGQANYSAAKLALVGLSNTLAVEGEKKNVRVNAIAPIAASRLTETVLPRDMLENLKPEYVTPLVAWLAHEECQENGGLYEVGGGYFGKLRWERTEGKVFKLGREISPEAVRNAWDDVTDWKKATHPANITESLSTVMSNLSTKSKGGNEFIDVDQALGYELPELESSYDERDLALYALGIGAKTDELDYLYEGRGPLVYAACQQIACKMNQ